jgi:hypothetical protein
MWRVKLLYGDSFWGYGWVDLKIPNSRFKSRSVAECRANESLARSKNIAAYELVFEEKE